MSDLIKERPILFSAPMVRALRENRKTQTRRTRGLDKINAEPDAWARAYEGQDGLWVFSPVKSTDYGCGIKCPYGVAGDRLWCRESWKKREDGLAEVWYRADGHIDIPGWPWKPSIHMPRWASRDTLEVVSVRPERLQHITAADSVAEGCESCTPYDQFRALWHSINAKTLPWSKNPWVWVISLKRLSIG